MTVVVAFVGSDGAVMASDSEATESGHSRYDVEKIWKCNGVLLGYTGYSYVRDLLATAVEETFKKEFGSFQAKIDRKKAAKALQAAAGPVLTHAYRSYVPTGSNDGPERLAGALLVIGRDSEGYWLIELDHNNNASDYTDACFHTVGSGSAAAYVAIALLKNYDVASRGVTAHKAIAYRTVDTCINTIGGALGVGGFVQLWASEDHEAFEKLEGDNLDAVSYSVDQWTTIERETLDNAMKAARGESEEETVSVDLPEDLGDESEVETAVSPAVEPAAEPA